MVGQRAKHLSHAEAAAAIAAEAGLAIGHRDLQGRAGVLDAGIVRMRAQASEHADAAVTDDDFERTRPRSECDKACTYRLAMAENIVLELAERADNLGCDLRWEAGGEGGLVGAARPKLPQVRSLAIHAKPLKRKSAGLRVLFGASHGIAIKGSLDGRDERCFKHHGRKSFRVLLSGSNQLDQRPNLSRPLYANRPEIVQAAALGCKKQFVGDIEVADQRLPLFLSLWLHCPRSHPPAPAECHPSRVRGPQPP